MRGSASIVKGPALWLLPLAIILLLVFVYPVIEVVRLSFTDSTLTEPSSAFTLKSFFRLIQEAGFVQMLVVTMIFVAASVIAQMVLGLAIALMIDRGTKLKMFGSILTRTAVLTAWAIPGVVIGIIWKMMFSETDSGILNYLLDLAGVQDTVHFLSDPQLALVSATIANVWRGTAFSMIMLYAALQTFPADIMEAAKIDRANAWQRLTLIVIPVLMPIILINLILITVQTFNTFDMIMALTGGGPGTSTEVIALSIHKSIFHEFALGRGAANAVVLLLINLIMTVVYFKYMFRDKGA